MFSLLFPLKCVDFLPHNLIYITFVAYKTVGLSEWSAWFIFKTDFSLNQLEKALMGYTSSSTHQRKRSLATVRITWLNPKRAGLFGPISQPGGGGGGFRPPPKISETDWRNIKCVILVDSYDPPESIGTKKSTNIPCMTPHWRHKWRHVKNTKITKNRQNHGFSLFFQAKLHFLAMMCVKVCLHMFLLQINQINKIKHSESVSWKQKTRFVCNFHWKSVFGQFFVGPSALLRNAAS